MDTKTTIPISAARKDIFNIADKVQKTGVHYTLTDQGSPKAVILSAEEFESLQETLEVMRDFPNLEEDIRAARRDVKQGSYTTLDKLLEEEGYIAKTKSKA
jgi:antitoxin YefM